MQKTRCKTLKVLRMALYFLFSLTLFPVSQGLNQKCNFIFKWKGAYLSCWRELQINIGPLIVSQNWCPIWVNYHFFAIVRSLPIDSSLENKHSRLKLGYFLPKFRSKGPLTFGMKQDPKVEAKKSRRLRSKASTLTYTYTHLSLHCSINSSG